MIATASSPASTQIEFGPVILVISSATEAGRWGRQNCDLLLFFVRGIKFLFKNFPFPSLVFYILSIKTAATLTKSKWVHSTE